MNEISHADGGTVLQPDDIAIIVKADGQPVLAVPKFGDHEDVPEHVLALTAMFIRWQREPEWVDELAQWFKEQARG